MRLLEYFDEKYYGQERGQDKKRLHLWIPPNPSDTGTAMGAAYRFAMANGASVGPPMKHAFLCGRASTVSEIEQAVAVSKDTRSIFLGNINNRGQREYIAEAMANAVASDGVLGIFQGCSETGPRALGHRTIIANACNPGISEMLNAHVKYREPFRPLAPMMTLNAAKDLYHLSDGASDDNYNAYNYMVLTVHAKEKSHNLIPGVIHKDGTSRIQIVRKETDPLCYAILKALGRRLGLEVAVNTSLNVGTPIVQNPLQAIRTLHKSRGMSGLLLVAGSGEAYLAWHNILAPPKDEGERLLNWFERV
jgi:carbamoyltransferase